jgi:hypothetical protein
MKIHFVPHREHMVLLLDRPFGEDYTQKQSLFFVSHKTCNYTLWTKNAVLALNLAVHTLTITLIIARL